MKQILLLTVFALSSFAAIAQTDCRPNMLIVDYSGHNDHTTNTDETNIQTVKPDILIDNTPGGYWHGQCLPSLYVAFGIRVFSYITAGREGTEYRTAEDNLDSNIARVDAIAADGAAGVFLDEVDTYPAGDSQAYIAAIYHECQIKGLKLIVNPGTYYFDTFLVSHSDYIMTDEHYHGSRPPTTSELWRLDSVLVADLDATSVTNAAAVTDSARNNGFGYSYACSTYNSLPSWLISYFSGVSYTTPTPTITYSGGVLYSSSPTGNQWYSTTSGMLSGADGQNFTPMATDYYYDIVTQGGCKSDTSGIFYFTTEGFTTISNSTKVNLYPNPVTTELTVEHGASCAIALFDIFGQLVLIKNLVTEKETLPIAYLPMGLYVVKVKDQNGIVSFWKIEKQ